MSKDEILLMLDQFHAEHKALEQEVNALSRALALGDGYFGRIEAAVHRQTKELTRMYNGCADKAAFLRTLRGHPFHEEIIMQSAYGRHILAKPYGYPGDKDLMIKTCTCEDEGETNYAILSNRVYLRLPAAEGVRARKASLRNAILQLKPGSRVFNLACGPALELQEALRERPDLDCTFHLVDHDQQTLDYLSQHLQDDRIHLIKANAMKITPAKVADYCGGQPVHLAYSSGLFDYVPQRYAPRIANAMFESLTPEGQLIIGNYLALGPDNPHQEHHKNMMELYAEWFLIYRTRQEILAFTANMDPTMIESVELQDEYFGQDTAAPATIGFLMVRRKGEAGKRG